MDADRFDTLSRRLGAVDTRRSLLRVAGAVSLLRALMSLGSTTIAAEAPLDQVQHRAARHHQRKGHQHRHDRRKGLRKSDHRKVAPLPPGTTCPGAMINGGCFHVSDTRRRCACPTLPVTPCDGCVPCDGCFSNVDGSEQTLCAAMTDTRCVNTEDCPAGQACWRGSIYRCIIGACYRPPDEAR